MGMYQCESCAYRKRRDKLVVCCCSQLAFVWRELWRQLLPRLEIEPYRCNHWEPAAPSGELLKPRPVTLCGECGRWYERGGHVKDGICTRFGICTKDYEFTSENNGCCDGTKSC